MGVEIQKMTATRTEAAMVTPPVDWEALHCLCLRGKTCQTADYCQSLCQTCGPSPLQISSSPPVKNLTAVAISLRNLLRRQTEGGTFYPCFY